MKLYPKCFQIQVIIKNGLLFIRNLFISIYGDFQKQYFKCAANSQFLPVMSTQLKNISYHCYSKQYVTSLGTMPYYRYWSICHFFLNLSINILVKNNVKKCVQGDIYKLLVLSDQNPKPKDVQFTRRSSITWIFRIWIILNKCLNPKIQKEDTLISIRY